MNSEMPQGKQGSKDSQYFLSLIDSGDLVGAFRLLHSISDINITDKNGNTALILVAMRSRTNSFSVFLSKSLINTGLDINAKNSKDQTALIWASKQENPELIELLILNGANIDIIDSYGYSAAKSPLFYKIQEKIKISNDKLSYNNEFPENDSPKKVKKDENDEIIQTPIYDAIKAGNKQKALNLIQQTETITEKSYSLFEIALSSSMFDICEILIDKGVDINDRNEYGDTLLHNFAHFYQYPTFCRILELGADPNCINIDQISIINYVMNLKQYEMAAKLINFGADVNSIDSGFIQPFLDYLTKKRYVNVAKKLVTHSKFEGQIPDFDNFNKDDDYSDSYDSDSWSYSSDDEDDVYVDSRAVIKQINKGNSEKALDKIYKGQKIKQEDFTFDVIDRALENSMDFVLKKLISKGLNLNKPYHSGQMLLHHYVFYEQVEKFIKLLDLGADPNISDNLMPNCEDQLMPILNYVCKNWRLTENSTSSLLGSFMVKLLIDRGANKNLLDSSCHQPLFYFQNHGAALQLIENGANINILNDKNEHIIFKIIIYGDEYLAMKFIEKGLDINIKDKNGRPLILYAIMNRMILLATMLIEIGVNTDYVYNNNNLLHLSILYHLPSVGVALIKKGMDIFCKNIDDKTPIALAIEENQDDIASLLISKGANINIEYPNKTTMLIKAAQNKMNKTVKSLIEAGAKVSEEDSSGNTALFYLLMGAYVSDQDLIIQLIEKSDNFANLEDDLSIPTLIQNKLQKVAVAILNHPNYRFSEFDLHYAIKMGEKHIALALLEHGADYNIADNEGKTPLMYAMENKMHSVIKMIWSENESELQRSNDLINAIKSKDSMLAITLIDSGADITRKDENGFTVLKNAVENSLLDVCKKLIENGCKLNEMDNDGQTLLHYFAKKKDITAFSNLLELEMDPNIVNAQNVSILNYVLNLNYIDMALQLISKNAKIDMLDQDVLSSLLTYSIVIHCPLAALNIIKHKSFTPKPKDLVFAISQKESEVALALIDSGVDINSVDDKNKSTYEIAIETGQILVAISLKSHGFQVIENETTQKEEIINENNDKDTIKSDDNKVKENNQNIEEEKVVDENCVDIRDALAKHNQIKALEFLETYPYKTKVDQDGRLILYDALENSMYDFCKILVEKGIDINNQDYFGQTLLHHYVEKCDLERFSKLLELGANPNSMNKYKIPILSHILRFQENERTLAMIKKLVEKGADVNLVDRLNNPPLYYTSSKSVALYLIDHGADPSTKDEKGSHVIVSVFEKEFHHVCRRLLKEYNSNTISEVVIYFAIANNMPNFAYKLIQKCKKFKLTFEGNSLLHIAILYDCYEITKYIVESGVDINMKDGHAKTPLLLAIEKSNEKIAKYLIEKGADIKTKVGYKSTLMELAIKNNMIETVDCLINHGANLNEIFDGKTLLMTAFDYSKEIGYHLVEKGADVKLISKKGSLLQYVIQEKKDEEVAIYLIEKGSNINFSSKLSLFKASMQNKLPRVSKTILNHHDFKPDGSDLCFAISCGDLKSAKELIKRNVNVNYIDNKQKSPLMYAAEKSLIDLGVELVKHGADLNYALKTVPVSSNSEDSESSEEKDENKQIVQNNKTQYSTKSIILAIKEDRFEIADSMLNGNYDPLERDENENTVLILTAMKYSSTDDVVKSNLLLQICKTILSRNPSINAVNNKGENALMHAAAAYSPDMMMILINHGSDVKQTDKSGKSFVDYIRVIDFKEILKSRFPNLIIAQKHCIYDPDQEEFADDESKYMLHDAIRQGNTSEALKMISGGHNINEVDNNKCTPLMIAIKEKRTDIAFQLIACRANFDIANSNGEKALDLALDNHLYTLALTMIASGVDPNVKDSHGNTPLIRAAKNYMEFKEHQHEIYDFVRGLFSFKTAIDINAKNESDEDAIHFASQSDSKELSKFLKSKGAK